MSELSRETNALLEEGRHGESFGPADKARLKYGSLFHPMLPCDERKSIRGRSLRGRLRFDRHPERATKTGLPFLLYPIRVLKAIWIGV